jgi:hypothetical protein
VCPRSNATYPAVFWAEKVAWAQATYPAKPLTISETGGGGVYEWLNDTSPLPGVFWSQFYQKNVVSADAAYLASVEHISGL